MSARMLGMCTASSRAAKNQIISCDVAGLIGSPQVEARALEILRTEQIADVLKRTRSHRLHAITATALGTSLWRSEFCGLRRIVVLSPSLIDVLRAHCVAPIGTLVVLDLGRYDAEPAMRTRVGRYTGANSVPGANRVPIPWLPSYPGHAKWRNSWTEGWPSG